MAECKTTISSVSGLPKDARSAFDVLEEKIGQQAWVDLPNFSFSLGRENSLLGDTTISVYRTCDFGFCPIFRFARTSHWKALAIDRYSYSVQYKEWDPDNEMYRWYDTSIATMLSAVVGGKRARGDLTAAELLRMHQLFRGNYKEWCAD